MKAKINLSVLFVLAYLGCLLPISMLAQQNYSPTLAEKVVWDSLLHQDIGKIVFTKRLTYNSNHYYTEYLNSTWMPGGNLYLLSLKDGSQQELAPSLSGGVFGRFDISFDAKKIVFAYKASKDIGYYLYEVNTDGTNLHQLTFPPKDEANTVNTYKLQGYHHGTEDLDPCYLPDGGVVFISTRCHHGILCDPPDLFTSTVLYRIDGDGGNMLKLSNSSVSENTPSMMSDGRILYTRWEYVDKGAVAVKCLWSMNPDGSGTNEVYGNDINFPTTMIMGRQIPGSSREFVFTGTPHCCPQNGIGTIVRIDMSKDIRTKEPMTYMTPYVEVREEAGFAFLNPKTNVWYKDGLGRGPLFRESYPLNRSLFLVSHKPEGAKQLEPTAYSIYLLNEKGDVAPLYSDNRISCFNPMPLVARKTPPVITSKINENLAAQNMAECVVADVYAGLEGIERGKVKFIRVLEQVPRPWGARRFYPGDEYDQQHPVITKDTHLGLKVQHGVVTVEKDGSAHFLVPANRNIFLQVLDENYLALQTERTYVNYIPGEVRSCVGCHETQGQAPSVTMRPTLLALKNKPQLPQKQIGEINAKHTLSYATNVQPVWDKNCVKCHSGDNPAGKLNLSGEKTKLFNISYESLVPERRKGPFFDRGLLGLVIGENHPKTGNINYLPSKSLGSHTSMLVAMLAPDKVTLADDKAQKRVALLLQSHKDIHLSAEELLPVTNWIDTNCQYYGSYYGKRNLSYKDEDDFRTEYGYDETISPVAPVPCQLKTVSESAKIK
jgi:hypothetical protein